jgi:putative oxidoreductase
MKSLLDSWTQPASSLRQAWWALPLRAIVGYGFIAHGCAKLARGPAAFTGILHALHMPFAPLLAWATILTELIGGLAVLAGAFIPLASVPMVTVLIVAILTVHLPNGFSSIKLLAITPGGAHFGQPGYETDLLYLAGLAALVLGGCGPFALDSLLMTRRNESQKRRSPCNCET